MPKPSFAEIQGVLHEEAERIGRLPGFEIAVLRNVVVESIEPYLRYLGFQAGLRIECRFGGYDTVLRDASSATGPVGGATAAVVVLLRLETLSWDLARRFPQLSPAERTAEIGRVRDFVSATLTAIRARTLAPILWVGFERPLEPSLGLADQQGQDGQTDLVGDLNRFLRAELSARSSAYFVDIDAAVARVGAGRFYDSRYWHLAKAPYARAGLEELAAVLMRSVRAVAGLQKKVLVLDCDNVLWGGIVGEEGALGVTLGPTHPGSGFVEFQHELVNLAARGVILALASKNNEEDVWEVFARHPAMVLRRDHIAAARINWNDKAENLRSLAQQLNVGLDSFVFMDDGAFEIGRVASALPEVTCVELPADRPADYRAILLAGGWFDGFVVSAEDRKRSAMYRAEAERRDLKERIADLPSYYRSLEMVLAVQRVDRAAIPRVAQLTQKTNQFNLTTRRYSEAEIGALAAGGAADVVTLGMRDRFGDAGLTGVAILRYEGDAARIDTFLLSCRVLGRGVEDAFLVQCLKRARSRGCRIVTAEFIPTKKNAPARDFLPRHGFQLVRSSPAESSFRLGLEGFDRSEPDFFARIDSDLVEATTR